MKTFNKNFWVYFTPFVIFIILILFFPYWLTRPNFTGIDFSNTGNIGDTIGGILSPFISLAAAILTFFAFWVQFKANEQQKIDLRIERFENKFYELLRLHRSNIEEVQISNLNGRKVFVKMYYELKYCYELCEEINLKLSLNLEKADLMDISYSIFFYGIGENSEKYFQDSFTEIKKKAFKEIKIVLIRIQSYYKQYKKEGIFSSNYEGRPNRYVRAELYYLPFNGHVSHLSHYFIHLFQTANFIVKQDNRLLNDEQKYGYIKMLRSQLSNFEQLLMYYNSISWFNEEWREIFTKYKLIKNIPIPLCDFYISPEIYYKKEIDKYLEKDEKIFNWQ